MTEAVINFCTCVYTQLMKRNCLTLTVPQECWSRTLKRDVIVVTEVCLSYPALSHIYSLVSVPESIALIDEKYNLVPINEKSMENAAGIFQDRMVYVLLGIESG